jgi:hypothetical protein
MQCATHAGILSSVISTAPFGTASQTSGTLSYPLSLFIITFFCLFLSFPTNPKVNRDWVEKEERKKRKSHSFGDRLNPRWIVGALSHSTSELLRTL